MNKREVYKKYHKFSSVQLIGQYWIDQVKRWIPLKDIMSEIALTNLVAMGLRTINWWIFHNIYIPFTAVAGYVIIKYYGFMLINWLFGLIVIKIGLNKAANDVANKDENLNPMQVETINTLKAICDKLGVNHHFTNL